MQARGADVLHRRQPYDVEESVLERAGVAARVATQARQSYRFRQVATYVVARARDGDASMQPCLAILSDR